MSATTSLPPLGHEPPPPPRLTLSPPPRRCQESAARPSGRGGGHGRVRLACDGGRCCRGGHLSRVSSGGRAPRGQRKPLPSPFKCSWTDRVRNKCAVHDARANGACTKSARVQTVPTLVLAVYLERMLGATERARARTCKKRFRTAKILCSPRTLMDQPLAHTYTTDTRN